MDGLVKKTFSAHPHFVPNRKAYSTLESSTHRPSRSTFINSERMGRLGLSPLSLFGEIQSSPTSSPTIALLLMAPPVFVSPVPCFSKQSPGWIMTWKPAAGTQIFIVPIDAPDKHFRKMIPSLSSYPFFNAYKERMNFIDRYQLHRFFVADRVDGFKIAPSSTRQVLTLDNSSPEEVHSNRNAQFRFLWDTSSISCSIFSRIWMGLCNILLFWKSIYHSILWCTREDQCKNRCFWNLCIWGRALSPPNQSLFQRKNKERKKTVTFFL